MPNTSATVALVIVAVRRLMPRSSMKNAMAVSDMDMVDVSDASIRRKKNRADQSGSRGSEWNIDGSTSNISVYPAAGETPKVNTAGNMMIPDRIATRVSREAVVTALRSRGVRDEK